VSFRLSRLALLLAVSTIVSALSGVVATYWEAQDEFRDVLDDDLENQGELLAQVLSSEYIRVPGVDLDALLGDYFDAINEDALWLTVYDLETGKSLSNLPHELPLRKVDDRDLHLKMDGSDWYGVQRKGDHVVVQVLRRGQRFDDVQHEVLEDITAPILVVSGINLLLLALLMAMVLWPLSRLSRQLENRGPFSLDPLELKSPAREIEVLRNTLNRLIGGIGETLIRERHFADDLAHEMRTPLTTLKLELTASEPDFEVMKFEVNRLAKVLEQLLTLARVEHGQWQGSFTAVRLDEVCLQELATLQPAFAAATIQTDTNLPPVTIRGDRVLLGVLLRNILNNVLCHCPARTSLSLRLEQSEGTAVLRVTDSGPGMTNAQLERLNSGFTRLDSRSQGLGLGLAICRRIVEVHAATMHFKARADHLPGLQIEFIFPIEAGLT